jgi:hypothetical protein
MFSMTIDSRLPLWFTVHVDIARGFLGPMDVSSVSDVSEVQNISIFRIEGVSYHEERRTCTTKTSARLSTSIRCKNPKVKSTSSEIVQCVTLQIITKN